MSFIKESDLNLDESINKRKSIRKFLEQPVSLDTERILAEAALQVPSATNSRPLRITSYRSEESRRSLLLNMEVGREILTQQIQSDGDRRMEKRLRFYWRFSLPMLEAPLLWAVEGIAPDEQPMSGEAVRLTARDTLRQTAMNLSLGCSLQNVMLKAVEAGLGSCVYTAPCQFLNAAGAKVPAAFIAIGYPADDPRSPSPHTVDEIFSIAGESGDES